jgi:phosphoglycolate phosphatase
MSRSVLARRYRGYLFDLDGTLIDSAPDICGALNAALVAAGLRPVTVELTRHWVGHGSRALIEDAVRHRGALERLTDDVEMARLLRIFVDHYDAHVADASRAYPGVEASLAALADQGAALGIVTNKLTALTHKVLEALGLAHFFGAVVCGDTLAERKPDAAPTQLACHRLGVTPADTLFVGDSATDVATARRAGLPVVCVRGGYSHGIAPELLGADAVIDTLEELLTAWPSPQGAARQSAS